MTKQSASSKSNGQKSLAGANLKNHIESILQEFEKSDLIVSFQSSYKLNHPDYEYKDQYNVDFIIETHDKKHIIVKSSTSYRSDRAKTTFYDLEGVKRYSPFAKDIVATIFVLPDEEQTGKNTQYRTAKKLFDEKKFYAPISHLLTLSEFLEFLEEYKHETEACKAQYELDIGSGDSAVKYSLIDTSRSEFMVADNDDENTDTNKGSMHGRAGNYVEKEVASLLSDTKILKQFMLSKLPDSHIFKIILDRIIENKSIELGSIIRIMATNTVMKLKNGGSPKTDIAIHIETDDKDYLETLSVKNSTSTVVSCHDYPAESFIRVIDCGGTKLEDYINRFQVEGSYKRLKESFPDGYSMQEFKNLLNDKMPKFAEWALMGKHDHENLISPKTQISEYLLIQNTNSKQLSFYTMAEYLKLLTQEKDGALGIFGWTFPSKQRGKRIQLKMPIIHR